MALSAFTVDPITAYETLRLRDFYSDIFLPLCEKDPLRAINVLKYIYEVHSIDAIRLFSLELYEKLLAGLGDACDSETYKATKLFLDILREDWESIYTPEPIEVIGDAGELAEKYFRGIMYGEVSVWDLHAEFREKYYPISVAILWVWQKEPGLVKEMAEILLNCFRGFLTQRAHEDVLAFEAKEILRKVAYETRKE